MDDIITIKSTSPRLIFIEGFDCVGKTHFIEKFSTSNGFELWEPKYHTDYTHKVVPYNDRYVLGIGLIDLAEEDLLTDNTIVINRGLISGLVYNKIYDQGVESMNSDEFIEYAQDKYSDPALIHTIYIRHESKENAQKLFDLSKSRNTNESYDDFKSFEEYWDEYQKFDSVYIDTLNTVCEDNYTVISSIEWEVLNEKSES